MKIYFLKDLSEDCVDAVIIAKESSRAKIEESIMKAKQKHEDDYQWEHLVWMQRVFYCINISKSLNFSL